MRQPLNYSNFFFHFSVEHGVLPAIPEDSFPDCVANQKVHLNDKFRHFEECIWLTHLDQVFRPAIEVLASGKDTIVVIPTGGGKTVTYVLPCAMTPRMAVVVSPLVMLMLDQVSRLRSTGINTCYYNTLLTSSEKQHILHHLREPTCRYVFVFVSPEAVIIEQFQNCLDKMKEENRLSFYIIDEAHCINSWGSDFRPANQQLGTLRKYNVSFAALTGTATVTL